MNRKLDISTDIIFAIIPAILFQPLVILGAVGLLDNADDARRSALDLLSYLYGVFLILGAAIGTLALVLGFYNKIKYEDHNYNKFIKVGTFYGSLCCFTNLIHGLSVGLWISVLLLAPIWVGSKYFYVRKNVASIKNELIALIIVVTVFKGVTQVQSEITAKKAEEICSSIAVGMSKSQLASMVESKNGKIKFSSSESAQIVVRGFWLRCYCEVELKQDIVSKSNKMRRVIY